MQIGHSCAVVLFDETDLTNACVAFVWGTKPVTLPKFTVEFYTVCGIGDTFDPSITLATGCPFTPVWDFDDDTQATGTSVTKADYANAGPHLVTLYLPDAQHWLTGIDVSNDKISGDFLTTLSKYAALTSILAWNNAALTGNLSSLSQLTSLTQLYISYTATTGNLSSLSGLTALTILHLGTTAVAGSINSLSGLTALTHLFLDNTGVTDGVIGTLVALHDCWINDCAWSQASVDALLSDLYTNRAAFTYYAPNLNIGGSNAAPSGTYQDATPPTTGKEYIYKLANDPDTEGFHKWTVTYTGGTAP